MKFQKKFSKDYPCMSCVLLGIHLKNCTYAGYLAFTFFVLNRKFALILKMIPKTRRVIITVRIKFWKEYLYRYSGGAYALPMRKIGDYCGVVDNGCIHYGLYISVSG